MESSTKTMEIENAGKFCEILRQPETLYERRIQQIFKGTEDLKEYLLIYWLEGMLIP